MRMLRVTLFRYFTTDGETKVVLLKDLPYEVVKEFNKENITNWCNIWCDIHDAYFDR